MKRFAISGLQDSNGIKNYTLGICISMCAEKDQSTQEDGSTMPQRVDLVTLHES
ncbi:MAG TPA: hypothetical protein VFW05_04920 [Verrucomicrobiae bacterium]|nr:hypothetical protein [Verrucomicrobiae bacterium]